MSLAGGNVTADTDGAVNDKCWTDFYSNLGFDVYLYNYAGFGRSYGSGYFGFGKTGGEEPYVEGVYGRMKRIIHGTFFSFGVCTLHFNSHSNFEMIIRTHSLLFSLLLY